MLVFLTFLATAAMARGQTYKDRDWSVSTYANCDLPVKNGPNRSVSWVKEGGDKKLRFVLHEGQKGGCSTDGQFRNRAPYWERAEVRQKGFMKLGQAYRISFQVTFDSGFTGDRETFFQIHGFNSPCNAAPLVMMKFTKGKLVVWALRNVRGNGLSEGRGRHKRVQNASVNVRSLHGKPSNFILDFDTREGQGQLTVYLNGRAVVQQARVEYAPCAKPHIKMGIYRPGGKRTGTSVALFDDLRIAKME